MTRRLLALGLFALFAVGGSARAEIVDLIPDESAGWSVRNVFAPLRSGHYYGDRTLEIQTTPPGATVDLFYVRSGFQLRYEQAEAPVTVMLPSRIRATSKDSVLIRASLDGYRQREHRVRVGSNESSVQLDLDPLPNRLESVAHSYFAGRASLTFLTREVLTLRMQESRGGFAVVLTQTAASDRATESLRGMKSPLVAGVAPQQLGEDLVVQVKLSPAARDADVELRSRQRHDPLRELYDYSIDFQVAADEAAVVERARAVLASIEPSDVMGCAMVYDEALRAELEPSALSRALAPTGKFTDPYLRAAMKRLGEVSPRGVIALVDDTLYRPAAPIELSAAMSQAAQARGYLALLRTFVAGLEAPEHRSETLRSLVAPEVSSAAFGEIVDRAEARERNCRSGS
ncbi:MAG: hypothetical protein JSU66_01935 [Deltaproteobacteria bacterium]|nr:MAG: hypothetical protein JSU66_01935 [Deltaproteobacteria bacterium]